MQQKEKYACQNGFSVSRCGNVVVSPRTNGRKLFLTKSGYYAITIYFNGKRIMVRIHRLQAYQKFEDKIYESGIVVRHLDGNPKNNSWENIAIGTASENMMDIPVEIRKRTGMIAAMSTRKHDHKKIIAFQKEHKSRKKTMLEFGIRNKGTLQFILKKSVESRFDSAGL